MKKDQVVQITIQRSMTETRARQIALEIVRYESARREFTINPHEEDNEFHRKAEEFGISVDAVKEFMLEVIMPVALSAHFGQPIVVKTTKPSRLDPFELGALALKYLQSKGVNTAPREFQHRLERIQRETKISVEELKEFYLGFVLTSSVEAIEKVA